MILASLQDVSKIKVDFSVAERYANDLRPVRKFYFNRLFTKEYKAVIEAVEPNVEKKTRTIYLRAICDNKDGSLVREFRSGWISTCRL